MTRFTPDALWELLPAVHRIRDAEMGGALRALIEVVGRQAQGLEEDVEALHENWFIETCDEWVVPYIGDLLGVRNLHTVGTDAVFSQRARVANTLAYRRRKGTATVLEQLARDTTGWPARAVEFFDLLTTTQHVNHPRPHAVGTPDLRNADALARIDTAFDVTPHTSDVRRIVSGRGLHNIPNVGLFLWRLQAHYLARVEARALSDPPDGRYRLHPFGLDAPLFNRPRTEAEITQLAREVNVPEPLRRRPLYDELEARRVAFAAGETPETIRFGDQPVLEVFLDGEEAPLAPEQIRICDLGGWDDPGWTPPSTSSVVGPDGVALETRVAVDPVRGRLAALSGAPAPATVETGHALGFPGDVGGGPYDRSDSLSRALGGASGAGVDWRVTVGRTGADFTNLTDALVGSLPGTPGWNAQPPGTVGVIALIDGAIHQEDLVGPARIEVPEESLLLIVSASSGAPDSPPTRGVLPGLTPEGIRGHLRGRLEVVGTAPADHDTPGGLVLDGLWIDGAVTVADGHLGTLRFAHGTLGMGDPAAPTGVRVLGGNPELRIELDHAVAGPLEAPDSIREIRVEDSVIQGTPALAGPGGEAGPPAFLDRATILGPVDVRELVRASNSLFLEPVRARRLQSGCVRFSYVPQGSRTPRRYRCQPSLALDRRAEALGLEAASELPAQERRAVLQRIRPAFTSTRFGEPAYTQLARTSPLEIRAGAEDGSEMGVWSFLRQPQRIANLEASLDGYLRFALEAGLVFVS